MSRCYIIAEVGLSHCGDPRRAIDAVAAFAAAGADAVKFQDHRWQVVPEHQAHPSPHVEGTRAAWYRRTEFIDAEWRCIREDCTEHGVDYICSPFSVEALRFQVTLEPRYIKIASGETWNMRLTDESYIGDHEVLFSTGMGEASETLRLNAHPMLCTSEYPCQPQHSRLDELGEHCEMCECVAVSDHTAGIWFPIAAVARGATMIEKHVHLDASMPHSDSDIALTPDKFAEMVQGIRAVEKALYEPSEPDLTEIRRVYLHAAT